MWWGLVHAGWQGTAQRICEVTVCRDVEEILVPILRVYWPELVPSIGPEVYEVGEDVLQRIEDSFGEEAKTFDKKV